VARLLSDSVTVNTGHRMELAQHVQACEDSGGGAEETQALLDHCQTSLAPGAPVSHHVVEALANIARTQQGRESILHRDLVQRLGAGQWSSQDPLTATQVCRLGGNLCYDSPSGRQAMLENKILEKLEESVRAVARLETEQISRLWLVLPSFLHNYCHDNLQCLGSVSSISTVLASNVSSLSLHPDLDSVAENYIGFLSGLQSHEGRLSLYCRPEVVLSVLHLLQVLQTEETLQVVLDFLQETLESEELSVAFTDHNVVESLLQVSSKAGQETADLSLDVLVLVSSHSSVLDRVLSPSQDCQLWSSVLSWLSCPPSPHHLATAALLCGNISTSASACLEVMESSAPANIIHLLDISSSAKLLHAVLGCLRNLAVCTEARPRLRELSLVDRAVELVVRLSQGRDHTVTPKLMSTLRLVSQDCADTSLTLGTNTELLTGLVSVGKVSLVPGLNIEATRLLSSVLRYSRHPEVSQLMVELGALPLLLGLLNSPHSQLINEMLVALNLMTAARPPRQEVVENIEPELLSNKVLEILQMEESKCPKEVKYNAVSLVKNILQWNIQSIKDHFSTPELREEIGKLDQDLDIVQQMMKLLS